MPITSPVDCMNGPRDGSTPRSFAVENAGAFTAVNAGGGILLWLPMVGIAVLNGAVREAVFVKRVGGPRAHRLSTLILIVLLGIYMWWAVPMAAPHSAIDAAALGLLWLALTVAFEFLFGHYAGKQPWRAVLADYNLAAGRLWALVPAWVAIAPYLFFKLRAR